MILVFECTHIHVRYRAVGYKMYLCVCARALVLVCMQASRPTGKQDFASILRASGSGAAAGTPYIHICNANMFACMCIASPLQQHGLLLRGKAETPNNHPRVGHQGGSAGPNSKGRSAIR